MARLKALKASARNCRFQRSVKAKFFRSEKLKTARPGPVRMAVADLMTAAGSLNYVDLEKFFAEASRVLTPEGKLVVYDVSPAANEWFDAFMSRYQGAG